MYIRYSLIAYKKLTPTQRKTHLLQLNDLIPGLTTCSDCTKLPEYDLKDIFLMSEETSIQTKVKANHEYEKLTLDELVDVIEQYETKRDICNAQNNTGNNTSTLSVNENGKRTKQDNENSNSNPGRNKKRRQKPPKKGKDDREKWCRFCSSKGYGFRRVHSHTDAECHLKKNKNDTDNKEYHKKTDQIYTMVQDLQKQLKKRRHNDNE